MTLTTSLDTQKQTSQHIELDQDVLHARAVDLCYRVKALGSIDIRIWNRSEAKY